MHFADIVFFQLILIWIAIQLTRIAVSLRKVVDVDKLRMVDVERGNVYKTHLGGKLKCQQEQK